MKKFEEELKDNNLEILVSNTGSSLCGHSYLNYDAVIELSKGWVSSEDHQAEIAKIELQNLKYREEIARMQKSLRKKNKAIKELNGAVKKSKARLKECEDLRIEANNSAAMEYSRKCEVVEERAEFKREIEKLKSQLEKQQPEIPESLAKIIETHDLSVLGNWEKVVNLLSEDALTWLSQTDNVSALLGKAATLCNLKIKGYTVAKEKRFYLKHIEMSKRDVYHDYYAQIRNERFEHDSVESGMLPQPVITGVTFTQSEIDNMETGSYEQIEVEE